MNFLQLWPLCFLILIPGVIIMYLLKQKALDHPVPSLFLWNEMYANKESDTPWEKLKKNKLLIIQLCMIPIFILALLAPFISQAGSQGDRVAILIDNSGSMNTLYSGKNTRLECAKASAVDYVRTLKKDTQITVIACNHEASTLVSSSVDTSAAISAINSIKSTHSAGDCQCGISICEGLNSADDQLFVVAFSDSFISFGNLSGTFYNFQNEAENVCFDYAASKSMNGKLTVLASLSNLGNNVFQSDVNLYGGSRLLAVSNVEVPPKGNSILYFEDLDTSVQNLRIELNTSDDLEDDNTYYFLNEEKVAGKVLLVTEQNLYLEKAITLNENIKLTKTNTVEGFGSFESEGFDLYIFDGLVPDLLPQKGNFLFINVVPEEYTKLIETNENLYVTISDSEYTEAVKDFTFGVIKAASLSQPIWATPILESEGSTVGFIGETAGHKVGVIGFRLTDSDFPLNVQFPVFIYNIISELADTSSLSSHSLFTDDTVRIFASAGENRITVKTPLGRSDSFSENILTYKNTQEPGIYTVSTSKDKEEAFAVNFNTSESRTESLAEMETNTSVNLQVFDGAQTSKTLVPYVIILIILFLAFEWLVYIKE